MKSHFFSEIDLIGYASGMAGYDIGAQDGPAAFFTWLETQEKNIAPFMIEEQKHASSKLLTIKNTLITLSKKVERSVQCDRIFTVIGGDHSCGIGTWSGVANQLKEPFSLIWVDAHMDAHTMESSPSKNIHGMPIAHLLGKSDNAFNSITKAHPAILPEHLFLIGVRSFEHEEALFLKNQGVRIYFIEEVLERGIQTILEEVLNECRHRTNQYGLSIDVDAFDAMQMPGTGLPVDNGLCVHEFLKAVSNIDLVEGFLGLEIAEYNPHRDVDFKTVSIIYQLLNCILSSG